MVIPSRGLEPRHSAMTDPNRALLGFGHGKGFPDLCLFPHERPYGVYFDKGYLIH